VTLYWSFPASYDVIGQVEASAALGMDVGEIPDEIAASLRDQAQRLGADGAVVISIIGTCARVTRDDGSGNMITEITHDEDSTSVTATAIQVHQ
jgi:hypothetical protein